MNQQEKEAQKLINRCLAEQCIDQNLINWYEKNIGPADHSGKGGWFEFMIAGNQMFRKFYKRA